MAINADSSDPELNEESNEQPTPLGDNASQPEDESTRAGDASNAATDPERGEPLRREGSSRAGLGLALGLVMVAAVGGVAGWLGYLAYQSHHAQQQRNLYVQIARQAALNLTTINYTQVDADVQRIIDSATGNFRDDFGKRSQPFIEVVKRAQSKSEGSIIEAGLESQSNDQAQVLVALNVNTSIGGVAESQPRAWRMRITVQKAGDDAKVANVEFVP
jgi:Mce-associated membrane protein